LLESPPGAGAFIVTVDMDVFSYGIGRLSPLAAWI
jgi:hypothetical protein